MAGRAWGAPGLRAELNVGGAGRGAVGVWREGACAVASAVADATAAAARNLVRFCMRTLYCKMAPAGRARPEAYHA
jgi:hypothetical protein